MKLNDKVRRVRAKHPESSSEKPRACIALVFAALGGMFCSASVSAQAPPPTVTVESAPAPAVDDEPAAEDASQSASELRQMPTTIGGGPEPVLGYYYTSPLKKFGSDLFVASYFLNLAVSLVYLAVVYPLQALFGSSKLETVLLWNLLPIAGPFIASFQDSVKSKPVWRVVLIGDAALQASGLVLGLIGSALSGRRALEPKHASRVELKLGVAGAGLAGVTLCVHSL